MYISILNILDKNLYENSNILVEVQINGRDKRILYSDYPNQSGQVFIQHEYCGEVAIFANGKFLQKIELPVIETIIINNGQKTTWNRI